MQDARVIDRDVRLRMEKVDIRNGFQNSFIWQLRFLRHDVFTAYIYVLFFEVITLATVPWIYIGHISNELL